jgi:RimJ/RimL family protein N-acetyltransferase
VTDSFGYGTPTTITVPTVVTDRMVLRCWQASDVDPYTAMNADPETMKYLDGTFDRAGTERLVTHLVGMWVILGHGMWAIEDRETGEFLGRGGTYYASGWPGVEVAVSVRRDRWGQGLGTEVVRAALSFGFATLDIDEMVTVTHRANAGMNGIARKLGMSFREVATVGPWHDRYVYAIAREEWERHPLGASADGG